MFTVNNFNRISEIKGGLLTELKMLQGWLKDEVMILHDIRSLIKDVHCTHESTFKGQEPDAAGPNGAIHFGCSGKKLFRYEESVHVSAIENGDW